MSCKRVPQAVAPAPEQRTGALDIPGQPKQVVTPYLTSAETVVYLRLGSESALYRLIREHRLPARRRGGNYIFDVRDLDAWTLGFGSALERERQERMDAARRQKRSA